ncbi:MAG: D-arabinono-1,4-lactone oxidase [Myxococcota bacterium]|nr:D-arabinono-1,4-lactone oxidase [Myxococcota bacterium]
MNKIIPLMQWCQQGRTLGLSLLVIGLSFYACGDPSSPQLAGSSRAEADARRADERAYPGKGDRRREGNPAEAPLRVLYLTDYSNFWHNYQAQQETIIRGLKRHLSAEVDLVGKDPEDTLNWLEQPGFALGYDAVIYNICFADLFEPELIDNVISQTRELGVPAVLLHCTMHSFQQSSPSYPENSLELRAAEWDWRERFPDRDFPYWWRFTGVDTLSHDWPRRLEVDVVDSKDPVTRFLGENFSLRRDELYQNIQVKEEVTPLLSAYSVQSRRDHLVAWTHRVGEGRVFATTLGHDRRTVEEPLYHRLIAHGLADVVGVLEEDGSITAGYEGTTRQENYQATVVCEPGEVVYAGSVDEVQAAVRRAAQKGLSIKAISLPNSNSNSGLICPRHGGLSLNLSGLNRVLSLDREKEIVYVEPGIRAVELSRFLHREGFAIAVMPDYTGVSIAGAIGTGAHHSSLRIPASMSDLVDSLVIVDGRGELRRLQGEEVAATATHLGQLGIVVEVGLRVEPQFKLRYGFDKGEDEGLEEKIEAMVRAHDYARVMWFAGTQHYVLDYYDRVDPKESGRSQHNVWASGGSVFRFIGDLPYRLLNQTPLLVQCQSARLRYNLWSPPFKVEASNRSTPVGWSHEMLGSACDGGACPWDNDAVRSRTMEATFPLRRLSEWMGDVRTILAARRACFPILGIYLRFSRASDRWMSFNYGEDVVSIEIHIPKVATETYHERSADVYDEIMQLTFARYQARPHWGKNSTPAFVGIGAAQYPRWADFLSLKEDFDPDRLFENKLWGQIMTREPVRRYPGCVLARDCICAEDSDCGADYRCVSGAVYQEARVCQER